MADPLQALAARASEEPFFLAHVLAAYALSEQLDDPGLADRLGCSAGDLPMLRLCRTPASEPGAFLEDVSRIAERFRMDPEILADAVKRGRVVLRFQVGQARRDAPLLAARDQDNEPPPSAEDGSSEPREKA